MFGKNIPGVTWNSWYNPFDNVASTAKNVASVVPSFGMQNGQTVAGPKQSQPEPSFDPNQMGGLTDRNYNNVNPGGNANTGQSSGGGDALRVQQEAARQQALRVSQAQGILQGQLGRLPGQLDIARGNINDQFNVRGNELQSGFNAAQNTYNTQSTQNRQNLVTDRNNINDIASQGLRGLMRMLGAFGAGGSSDRFNAGDAVTTQANSQLSGAGQTFSGNQSGLDTNWGNFKTQDEQERAKLNDWKTQQLNSAEQQSMTNRQDILSRLAGLQSDAGSAQRYIDESSALNSQIDNLGRFSPTYTGNTPVFQAPTLNSYDTGQGQVAVRGDALQGSGSTPFLSLLLGQDDRRRRF